MKTAQEYLTQIEAMAQKAKRWREKHPNAWAKVQFNFPPTVGIIMTITEAIQCGFVSCNDDGLSLITALGPWEDKDEPTVTMVRAALEI